MQLRYLRRGIRGVVAVVVARSLSSSSANNMTSIVDITRHAAAAGSKTAIREVGGRVVSYADLLRESKLVKRGLERVLEKRGREASRYRVCVLTPNCAAFSSALLGIWSCELPIAAVPLCKAHPEKTLEYYVTDSEASVILTTGDYADKVRPIAKRSSDNVEVVLLDELLRDAEKQSSDDDHHVQNKDGSEAAMIIYTSGTTGPPKGVVLTADNVRNQYGCMLNAWGWSDKDNILHVLPLHHTHGIVNALLCPLSVGAEVTMVPEFNADLVWKLLASADNDINVFMAVPTIYAKLVEAFPKTFSAEQWGERARNELRSKIRLMVSGSAALPEPVLKSWQSLTGHFLLERYGMSEIGMALSNPLAESDRRAGCVGFPFPGVEARIVSSGGQQILCVSSNLDKSSAEAQVFGESDEGEIAGDLQIRGRNVFREYYNKPEATAKEFTDDGWFKTGDSASMDASSGVFRIRGRTSVDIIKSGGYKISALDVERAFLSHPAVLEIAVVGVEDETWGQQVAAVAVFRDAALAPSLDELREWGRDKMPSYHLPRMLKVLDSLPKNNMGKINKKELKKTAFNVSS